MEEQIEIFSNYFLSVSQEFPTLQLDQLSELSQQKLDNVKQEDIPTVEEHEMYEILKQSKSKKSCVPGDRTPRLVHDTSMHVFPAAKIMNRIARTGTWPEHYQTEWGRPIEENYKYI